MNTPFVLEIGAPQPERAQRLASMLADELDARHAGTRRDGRLMHDGEPLVDIDIGRAASQRSTLRVGVRALDGQPLWLSPMPLPDNLDAAVRETLAFLERWAFIPARDAPDDAATRGAGPSVA